ncbi:MAG: energy transducer TonB [Acidobacteriaceae bacterium]|jgi:TonB family protein
MSIEKLRRSRAQALVATLVCLWASFAIPQQAAGRSSYVGSQDNGLVAVSSDHSQSAAVENQDIHQVGGAVLPPKVIHAPMPKYTTAARRARLEGHCIVELVVDAQGRPQDIHVKKTLDGGLDKNAIKAVKKYRFTPATMNGKPVAVLIDIDVHFVIY